MSFYTLMQTEQLKSRNIDVLNVNDRTKKLQEYFEDNQSRYGIRGEVSGITYLDVYRNIERWAMDSFRMVVQCDIPPNMSQNQVQMNGYMYWDPAIRDEVFYPFTTPITITVKESAYHDMLALKTQLQSRGFANTAQSTHTASVHADVSSSLLKLKNSYSHINDETADREINEINVFAKTLDSKNFPTLKEEQLTAAKSFIENMASYFVANEEKTGFSVKIILALVWTAMKDKNKFTPNVSEADVTLLFIQHLYEIQRGYNLDAKGIDDKQPDKPICMGGTINKLVMVLSTIHQDVEIRVINKDTAKAKYFALIYAQVLGIYKSESAKTALKKQIEQLAAPGGDRTLTVEIWEEVKKNIDPKFKEEFSSLLKVEMINTIINEINGHIEYVGLDDRVVEEINKISSIKQQENTDALVSESKAGQGDSHQQSTTLSAVATKSQQAEAKTQPSTTDVGEESIKKIDLAYKRFCDKIVNKFESSEHKTEANIWFAAVKRDYLTFKSTPTSSSMRVLQQTLEKIDENAKAVITTHRGFVGWHRAVRVFLGVIATILFPIAFAIKVNSSAGYIATFFKDKTNVETDTQTKLKALTGEIEAQLTPDDDTSHNESRATA